MLAILYRKTGLLAFLFFPALAFSQEVKFNDSYTVACHNCYEKKHATGFQSIFTYTKTIEIDIWNENFGLGLIAGMLGKSLNGDWYVKHKPQQRGNNNSFGGSFRNCLRQLKSWSDANADHDVITVYIDKKQAWNNTKKNRGPADLDNLLLSVFPKEMIFRPADLLQEETSLKKAAYNNWPSLDSLKGKFIFVITNGTCFSNRKVLSQYLGSQKEEAVCFAAPEINSEQQLYRPRGFSKQAARNIVFYNLKEKHQALAQTINSLECVSRVYGRSKKESYNDYEQLASQKVNFAAFYNYKITKAAQKEPGNAKAKTVL